VLSDFEVFVLATWERAEDFRQPLRFAHSSHQIPLD
jgi:hypothetical protein